MGYRASLIVMELALVFNTIWGLVLALKTKMADEDGEKKDNPFSFKKFVEKKHEVPQVSPYRKKKQQRAKNIFKNVKTPDIFEDEAPFPDVAARTAKPGQGFEGKSLSLCIQGDSISLLA